MPSLRAAFSRRWPSTTSPSLRTRHGILKPNSRIDAAHAIHRGVVLAWVASVEPIARWAKSGFVGFEPSFPRQHTSPRWLRNPPQGAPVAPASELNSKNNQITTCFGSERDFKAELKWTNCLAPP